MTVLMSSIWEDFSGPLKTFISKRIANQADAEDIFQEVFVKIHNSVEHLNDDSKIHSWVYQICRHAIIDYYRRNNKPVEIFELPGDLAGEAEADTSSNREIAGCLKVMINSLPEKYKEAILLTEFENLTQRELSERTGLSLSGAKSRVQRGREKLKEMLLECCHLEFDRKGNVIDYQHKSSRCKYC